MNEIDRTLAEAEGKPLAEDHDMKPLEPMGNAVVAPAHTIAAVALNLALKYHDMAMVKDGTLYQQYKLEGRNIETIHLDHVFETAIKIELHLMGASERIAKMVVDAIEFGIKEEAQEKAAGEAE